MPVRRGRSCSSWSRRDPPASASPPAPPSTWAPSSAPACSWCPRSRRRPRGPRRCWPGSGCWPPRWRSRRPSPRSACATRSPVARRRTCARRTAAAPAAVTGWWFYAGVLGGAPAVWLIGGFYVAHLTGGGRAVAVAAAAAMMVAVLGANARGLQATARMQLGLAALLAVLLLVAVAAALPSAHADQLDAVRAARMARGRDRGQPADALVRRLGGGRAPGRRLRRPAPAAAARDARGLRDRRRALPRAGGDHRRRARRGDRLRRCRWPTSCSAASAARRAR